MAIECVKVEIIPAFPVNVISSGTRRFVASLVLATMVISPGCLEEVASKESTVDWGRDYLLIDPSGHEDARDFIVGSPLENQTWG
ncbi:MAG: hypothetical protein VYA39_01240, partial [Candidatus Thermoplasmatota archaeon]|nr:hypothetical protein [Candidatus Thermoplasmatota archaeon]